MFETRLKELRKKANITQVEFAKQFHISKGTIAMWETGKRQPDYESLIKLADYFNVSLDYLLGREPTLAPIAYTTPDIIRIPVLGRIPAGVPMEAIEDVLDYEEAPADWSIGGREFFALQVKGDSMNPTYRDGDVVIFKAQPTCENGQDCAVMVNGDDATFKRVYRSERGVVLQPLNPAYEPLSFSPAESANIRILGVVWELRRKLGR